MSAVARAGRAQAGLPAALQPWAPSLAALRPDAAVALGPLVQRLDELFARHGGVDAHDGEVDGYGDVAPRGPWERLVPAEWALADDVPDEFWRRAAAGELLRTALSRRHDRHPGTVLLLVDNGPGQAGACRLVQLAAAVVLHRRAALAGAGFALEVLRGPGPSAAGGGPLATDADLATLLRAWWGARARTDGTPADVVAALAGRPAAGPTPRAWVVGGPRLREAEAPGVSALTCEEIAWDAVGVREVRVGLGGERIDLPVPVAPIAVAVLRGQGVRPERSSPTGTGRSERAQAGGHPWFPDLTRRLLLRTSETEIVLVRKPRSSPWAYDRSWTLPGPVVAWGAQAHRQVTLVRLADDTLLLQARGKAVRLAGRRIPAERFGWIAGDLDRLAAGAPAKLALVGDGMLVWGHGLDSALIEADGSVRRLGRASRVPLSYPGGAQDAAVVEQRFPLPWLKVLAGADRTAADPDWCEPVAAHDAVAYRHGTSSRWALTWLGPELPGGTRALHVEEVDVPEGETVIGPVWRGPERPELACQSAAGFLVRLRRGDGATTPQAAAELSAPTVHPSLPWLAGVAEDGRLVVVDLQGGTRHVVTGGRA